MGNAVARTTRHRTSAPLTTSRFPARHFKSKNLTIMNRGWSFFGSPLDGDVFAQVMDMNSGYLVRASWPST